MEDESNAPTPKEERHRPSVWPDYDEEFRTHDNAASWWLFVLTVPLMAAAVVIAVWWLL